MIKNQESNNKKNELEFFKNLIIMIKSDIEKGAKQIIIDNLLNLCLLIENS